MKFAAIVYPAVWIGLSLTAVHQSVPMRTTPEEFGWSVPFGMAAILIPTAVLAYLAGKESNDN